jgi:hypothetical protein
VGGCCHETQLFRVAELCWADDPLVTMFRQAIGWKPCEAIAPGNTAGLIQSLSQCLLPMLRAWAEVGGIASSPCLKALLPQPISI